MKHDIEVRGLEVDATTEEFILASVAFATWRPGGFCVERVWIRLWRDPGAVTVTCEVRGMRRHGERLWAVAICEDLYEAVLQACDRFEAVLWRSPHPRPTESDGRMAA